MEEKLQILYNQCIKELKSIGINIYNNKSIGKIDIKLSSRPAKRYGCCKHEDPDKKYYTITRKGYRKYINYEKFNINHIEISKWVMDLNDEIIKNTIMHEIIHCIPYCNNHGTQFKKYANYINTKLGYNISRLGNKEEDYKRSGLINKYENNENYNYKIICQKCGQSFYRKRLNKNLLLHYRCGICGSKLDVISIKK